MEARPFSGRLGVKAIRLGCAQTAQQLACSPPPKLMIPVWVRLLFKMSAWWYTAGHTQCTSHLFLVLFPPIIPHRPWRLRGAPNVMGLVSTVSFLSQEIPGDTGSVLCQLRLLLKRLASMSVVLERGLLLS